jgi:hypothetical protein
VKEVSYDEVHDAILAAIRAEGSQTAFARKAGVHKSFISDVVRGLKDPSRNILRMLGYDKEVRSVPVYLKLEERITPAPPSQAGR